MILTVVLSLLGFAVSQCQEGYASCTYEGVEKNACEKIGDCIPCSDSADWVSKFSGCNGYAEEEDSHKYCDAEADKKNGFFPYEKCPRACKMCTYEDITAAGDCPLGFTKIMKISGRGGKDADARFGISYAESQCFSGCVDDTDKNGRRKMETYLDGEYDDKKKPKFGCQYGIFEKYHRPAASTVIVKYSSTEIENWNWSLEVINGHIWGRFTESPTAAPDTGSPTIAVDDTSIDVTFEFGTGCEAGSGTFSKYMGIADAQNDIGIIPKGTKNVKITLELGDEDDLDIRLFDTTASSEFFTEGKALIAWCDEDDLKEGEKCNYGIRELVPDDGLAGEAVYVAPNGESMLIKYSGFAPDPFASNRGDESIEIVGEVVADLRMSAFAYQTGDVTVRYQWDAGTSECCQGLAACHGSFTKYGLKEKSTALVGNIPVGVKDVRIDLSSPDNFGDLDIRLYDTSLVDEYGEGKAIIAWCEEEDCNKGYLGSSPETGHKEEILVDYDGTSNSYNYSGYNGVPDSDGNSRFGTEFVVIEGTTERPLMMEVFSYLEGSAILHYSYWINKD